MYKEIKKCRVCGNDNLVEVLNLGKQALTGVFPSSKEQKVTVGPLTLVKCLGDDPKKHCGLVQLKHGYDLQELYSKNYGYRSGLNASMVEHLHNKVSKILSYTNLNFGDVIIDIGSNDATTLKFYPQNGYELIGIDPIGGGFEKYYPENIKLIPNFFNAATVENAIGNKKVKVITSFSMFYDLEDPVGFARDIAHVLAADGIWVLEQSYMPEMLQQNSFDTVCHEHLEYYGLTQIKWIVEKADLRILDVEFNAVNGGSFSIIVGKKESSLLANEELIEQILEKEKALELHTLKPYLAFAVRAAEAREQLLQKIQSIKKEGKTIYGLGASTKGNVILQYCGITAKDISCVGEVNKDKFGKYTPGTLIPIISEKELLAKKPDYLLVLPWHFRDFFIATALFKDIKLLFPLVPKK
ncbi:MAG: hypothetical protein ACD_21C00014G0007 [uncultured bacterium]|nr:MAG: hypothetical protein ACD_21C00014G0007 [uncultured bacterium]